MTVIAEIEVAAAGKAARLTMDGDGVWGSGDAPWLADALNGRAALLAGTFSKLSSNAAAVLVNDAVGMLGGRVIQAPPPLVAAPPSLGDSGQVLITLT